jgi:hypothetical protein
LPSGVEGSLRGEYIRKALNLTSWEAAADLVRGWESSGQIGVVRAEIPTIKEAVEKYIADDVGHYGQAASPACESRSRNETKARQELLRRRGVQPVGRVSGATPAVAGDR